MEQGTGLIVFSLLILFVVLFCLQRILRANPDSALHQSKNWIYIATTFLGLVIIFSLMPIENSAKNSVFSLLGLVITAVIAISSTTFVSNAMAGIMLRIIRNFKIGDFIEVEDHFGRVSEFGLLHTEIQTKSRDLTTLPNLYLITNAVTVTPQDKALIDATLSLGYNISHHKVGNILKSAAEKIGLTGAFVQVTELGNYSINYRVAGFLDNPKLLLSMRSNLRRQLIDSLHSAGIEIVSPTFINQRRYRSDEIFISKTNKYQESENNQTQQTNVFDKAESAEEIANLEKSLRKLENQLKDIENGEKDTLLKKQQELKNKIKLLRSMVDNKSIDADS